METTVVLLRWLLALLFFGGVFADFASGRINLGEVYHPLFSNTYYTVFNLPLGTQYRTFVASGAGSTPGRFEVLLQNDRCVGGVHCNDPTEYLQQLIVQINHNDVNMHLTQVRLLSTAGVDYGVFLYNTDALLVDGGNSFVTCSSTDSALPLRTQKVIKLSLPGMTKEADYLPPVVGTQYKTKMLAYDGAQTIWAIEKARTLSVFDLNLNKIRDIVDPFIFDVCTVIVYEPTVNRLYMSGQIVQGQGWSITTLDVRTGQLHNQALPANVGNRLIRDISIDATTHTIYITAQAITMNLPVLEKGQLTMYTYTYSPDNFNLVPHLERSWMAGYFSGMLVTPDFYYMYDMLGIITRIRKTDITPTMTTTITITGPLCQNPVFNCTDTYPPVTNSRYLQPYFRAGTLLDENTAVFGGDWHGTITIVRLNRLCDDNDPNCHPPCKSHPFLAELDNIV